MELSDKLGFMDLLPGNLTGGVISFFADFACRTQQNLAIEGLIDPNFWTNHGRDIFTPALFYFGMTLYGSKKESASKNYFITDGIIAATIFLGYEIYQSILLPLVNEISQIQIYFDAFITFVLCFIIYLLD